MHLMQHARDLRRHQTPEETKVWRWLRQEAYDVDRDCDLSKIGVTVLRIQNETVREDPTAAADAILQKNQDPHPALRATLSRKRERALVDSEITRRV